MVLRAFAAHPKYRQSKEAKAAGALLKSSFFQPDVYTSYQSPSYWTRFLFWWPNLLTALDSLSLFGFTKDDPDIKKGLDWFIDNQQPDGLWKLESDKEIKAKDIARKTLAGAGYWQSVEKILRLDFLVISSQLNYNLGSLSKLSIIKGDYICRPRLP